MKLRYTPAAILDLQEIRDYIQNVLANPEAAQGGADDVVDADFEEVDGDDKK